MFRAGSSTTASSSDSRVTTEHGPFVETERDQIGPVDRKVGQPVRLTSLLLEQRAQPRNCVEILLRDLLAAQISLLVRDEVECKLVAVLTQETPREELVDVLERKGVRAHESSHVVRNRVG